MNIENGHQNLSTPTPPVEQLTLFSESNEIETQVIDELKAVNVLEMTPLDAINVLHQLQKKIK